MARALPSVPVSTAPVTTDCESGTVTADRLNTLRRETAERAVVGMFAWPTGEFHGMGIEGSVKLGYRKELAAIEDPEERLQAYEERVAAAYEAGKALNRASLFGIDDAIDPADSRRWLAGLLKSLPPAPVREGKKRPYIDAW